MATDSLPGAIVTAFRGDPVVAPYFTGGMYAEQEPEEMPAMPWVTLKIEGGQAEWDTGGNCIESARVMFEVYAETAAASENGAALLMTHYDAVPPTYPAPGNILFATATMMSFLRTSPKKPSAEQMRGPDGEIVWKTDLDYASMVSRVR